MGLGSLGASSLFIICGGLLEPLKTTFFLALGALDAHHESGHPCAFISAETSDGADDPVNLQVNRWGYPTAAVAQLITRHGRQGRSGDFGKHLAIMRTPALVHVRV